MGEGLAQRGERVFVGVDGSEGCLGEGLAQRRERVFVGVAGMFGGGAGEGRCGWLRGMFGGGASSGCL